jgi:transcriptional regulator with XRE-family HTH domain
MAELIGMSERYYQYYEAGTKEPNMATIKRIVEVLDVSADYLIGCDKKG